MSSCESETEVVEGVESQRGASHSSSHPPINLSSTKSKGKCPRPPKKKNGNSKKRGNKRSKHVMNNKKAKSSCESETEVVEGVENKRGALHSSSDPPADLSSTKSKGKCRLPPKKKNGKSKKRGNKRSKHVMNNKKAKSSCESETEVVEGVESQRGASHSSSHPPINLSSTKSKGKCPRPPKKKNGNSKKRGNKRSKHVMNNKKAKSSCESETEVVEGVENKRGALHSSSDPPADLSSTKSKGKCRLPPKKKNGKSKKRGNKRSKHVMNNKKAKSSCESETEVVEGVENQRGALHSSSDPPADLSSKKSNGKCRRPPKKKNGNSKNRGKSRSDHVLVNELQAPPAKKVWGDDDGKSSCESETEVIEGVQGKRGASHSSIHPPDNLPAMKSKGRYRHVGDLMSLWIVFL